MATPQITAQHPVARLHPLPPLRARLRRVGVVLLVVCNVVAAGTAVFGANAVLTHPGSLEPTANPSVAVATDNAQAASAFYAAMNEAIRTGDGAPSTRWLPRESTGAPRAPVKHRTGPGSRATSPTSIARPPKCG